jgi:dolichol-phosphate mannosyltransferase
LAKAPPGLPTVLILLLFILGSNSLFLGVIGEYVGRIYNQGKQRPVYIVDRTLNIHGHAKIRNCR